MNSGFDIEKIEFLSKTDAHEVKIYRVKTHWTEPHVIWDNEENAYIAYDETGMEHYRSVSKVKAQVSLIIHHAATLTPSYAKEDVLRDLGDLIKGDTNG